MIRKLYRIAQPLQRLMPLLILLGLAGLSLLLLSLLENPWLEDDRYMMPGLIMFGWSLTLYCIAISFRVLPELPGKETAFLDAMGMRLRWAFCWLLAALATLQALAMLLLSYQLARTWFMNY